ncbi:MAG: DUF4105 domain-containing protein, partial [Pseudomonadota bacterium]|nr:DUF4105 domain-containing protein [Pseudomonadota bacterium]
PKHVVGRTRSRKLLLERHLLDDWMARTTSDRFDDTDKPAALVTLIHELAHVYDSSQQGKLSRDPRLLDLAGWQKQPLRPWRSGNAFRDRSPDLYELHNPREFVAVNLEHYLLDPDYVCRRPALAVWFAVRFGDTAQAGRGCTTVLPYVQSEGHDGGMSLLDLDPARVYAVEYLLAENGDEAMSLWGHSMLRLVICAPTRAPGPECRLDLHYHRVLSFRAFVNDVQISSWRGLTGSYPSRLFVLPLNQVIDEYNQVELRDLISIPLRLRADEIAALLERAARVHWSYDGRYYFIGNNCAVETFKLLHDGVLRLSGERLSSVTPHGLLRRLEHAGFADRSVLNNPAEALREGYRFESAARHFQAMLDVARETLPLPTDKVEDWFALPPSSRRPWLQQATLRAGAALFLLEQATFRRQELRMRDFLKRRLLAGDVDAERARDAIRLLLDDIGAMIRPAAMLDGDAGYGLPQWKERSQLLAQVESRNARLTQGWTALREKAPEQLPGREREVWEGTEANLALIGERLRKLATEESSP